MLRNYLKVAVRNLLKDKLYTIINLVGLGISITVCFIIFQYAYYELNFDSYKNADNIYRVTSYWNDGKVGDDRRAKTVPWTGPGAKELFPEIEEYGRFAPASTFIGKKLVKYEEITIHEERIFFADSGLLKIFSIPLVRGTLSTVLKDPFSIVLTESIAKKYFGSVDNIIGKTLTIDVEQHLPQNIFKVTGIVKDPPANSHIQFDMLLSFNSFYQGFDSGTFWWHWDYTYNYYLLRPGADPVMLGKKMTSERERIFGKDMGEFKDKIEFVLQPLGDIHLTSHLKDELGRNGDKALVISLIIIGVIILIIGYINYVNLAITKSFERAREIGVRKTFGAGRPELIKQFLTQAFIINLASVVLAVLISLLFMPFFERLTEVDLSLTRENILVVSGFLLLLVIIGTFASGFYPAFVLSSFDPVEVLKDTPEKIKGLSLRKMLVIGQFASAMLIVAGTIAVYKQIQYMKNHELGMNLDKVVVLEGPSMYIFFKKYHVFKSELLKYPGIKNISSASAIPGDELGLIKSKLYKKSGEKTNDLGIILIDDDYFKALGIDFIAGRPFDLSSAIDKPSIILNEAAANALGYDKPLMAMNELVKWDNGYGHGGDTTKIIGLVKNYYQQSLKSEQPPIIYLPRRFYNEIWTKQYFIVKYTDDKTSKVLDLIRTEWNKVFDKDAYQYLFLQDHYDLQYKEEQRFGNIFTLFTILAIVIAALGLYGLSSFIVIKRAKEIAIRKVLSASNVGIMKLLITDYVKLILISYLIGLPIGYFLVRKWLDNYPIRIELGVWFFILPLLLILFIALVSISYQTIRAARRTPIVALRNA